jgi:hypothetical protein
MGVFVWGRYSVFDVKYDGLVLAFAAVFYLALEFHFSPFETRTYGL